MSARKTDVNKSNNCRKLSDAAELLPYHQPPPHASSTSVRQRFSDDAREETLRNERQRSFFVASVAFLSCSASFFNRRRRLLGGREECRRKLLKDLDTKHHAAKVGSWRWRAGSDTKRNVRRKIHNPRSYTTLSITPRLCSRQLHKRWFARIFSDDGMMA